MIAIIDNTSFYEQAKRDNAEEIWLLNDNGSFIYDDIINEEEVTQSMLVNAEKFPRLMTYISDKHSKDTPDYRVYTDNPDSFKIEMFTCNPDSLTGRDY